jgi:hypothetical protein
VLARVVPPLPSSSRLVSSQVTLQVQATKATMQPGGKYFGFTRNPVLKPKFVATGLMLVGESTYEPPKPQNASPFKRARTSAGSAAPTARPLDDSEALKLANVKLCY